MSSGTGDHGLPVIAVGATTPREVLNQVFALLEQGLWKRGTRANRPDISGETTPGQWYYAEDLKAIYYDAGTAWRLMLAHGVRTFDGTTSALLLDSDHIVELDATDQDVDLNAGACLYHEGHFLTVRRSDSSSYVAKVSLTLNGAAVEMLLPTQGDSITFLGEDGGWSVFQDRRAKSDEELITGKEDGGSTVYKISVPIAAGPNAGSANIAHGISSLDDVLEIKGILRNGSSRVPLPQGGSSSISVEIDDTNIVLVSSGNYAAYSGAVTLLYTKS